MHLVVILTSRLTKVNCLVRQERNYMISAIILKGVFRHAVASCYLQTVRQSEGQAAAEAAERERIYRQQYPESRRKRLARQAEARRIKPVAWYHKKVPKTVLKAYK